MNAIEGHKNRSMDMLTSAGPYAPPNQQVMYDPGVYAQIATAALRAWKALSNKAAGGQLPQVLQGSEPYSDSVNPLSQLAGGFP